MKYIQATFKGYIGFYSGLGIEEVNFDFRSCKHSIILIIGMNGCGKSTFINSLNLFPDPSSSFIPGKDAEKILVLTDLLHTYEIRIISEADNKGGRKTTKAYFKKDQMELNPNGNVSSYKEILFNEFELDTNYISLSNLSSSDRGLGDKTPAERKRFVSSVLENLEVYNNIYKKLNKKALVLKSQLNTIHTKIQNIGQKEVLEDQLGILKKKEMELNQSITNANNEIIKIQTKSTLDEEELYRIQEANTKLEEYQTQLQGLQSQLDVYHHKTHIAEVEVSNKVEEMEHTIQIHSTNVEVKTVEWKSTHAQIGSLQEQLSKLNVDLMNCKVDTYIEGLYNKSKEKVNNLRILLRDNTDDQYYKDLITFSQKFIALLDVFYDGLTPGNIAFLVNEYSPDHKNQLLAEQHQLMSFIENRESVVKEIEVDLKVLSALENRPKNCKIDSCPYIIDAVKLKKDPEKLINDLEAQRALILEYSGRISEIQEKIDLYDLLFSNYMKLVELRGLISEYSPILLKSEEIYRSLLTEFDLGLQNLNQYNDIRDITRLHEHLNQIILLKEEESKLLELEGEYKLYQDRMHQHNQLITDIEHLENSKKSLEELSLQQKQDIDTLKDTILTLQNQLQTLEEYRVMYTKYIALDQEANIWRDKLSEYQTKSKKAMEQLGLIEQHKQVIASAQKELEPIQYDMHRINGQLTLLESYYQEYNQSKSTYNLIEGVKKYCSPTGGGIQTVFMQLYMKRTLELSNDVLARLFGGEYQLLDFIINDKEFRIPFVGSGLPVDDISSGSSSQISIMGMVINLVLFHQAATKYNIARLDEIDAGLDNRNRFEFFNFIQYTKNILGIEQVFAISHSIEANNSNADIIKLKTYDDFESGIQSGNIIFDWSKEISNGYNTR